MKEKQAVDALLAHWKATWEALRPTIPWTDINTVFATATEWVRITMAGADRTNQSIGGARLANVGIISVTIFVKVGLGTGRLRELADDVRTCLENASIASPVPDDEPLCIYAGPSKPPFVKNSWLQMSVDFRYRWDELRPPAT